MKEVHELCVESQKTPSSVQKYQELNNFIYVTYFDRDEKGSQFRSYFGAVQKEEIEFIHRSRPSNFQMPFSSSLCIWEKGR